MNNYEFRARLQNRYALNRGASPSASPFRAEGCPRRFNDVASGLGKAFTDEFLSTLAFLDEHPSVGSHLYAHFLPGDSLRVWSLDRFPFLVLYLVSSDALDMLRVLRERRDIVVSLIAQ
ncbi:hypothetical protein [Cupriavidus necator]